MVAERLTPTEAIRRIRQHPSAKNDAATLAAFHEAGYKTTEIRPRYNVLAFTPWLACGRIVKKGEHGTRVDMLTPTGFNEADEPTGFRRSRVVLFHEDQTRPLNPAEPLPPRLQAKLERWLDRQTANQSDRPRPRPADRPKPKPSPRPTDGPEIARKLRTLAYNMTPQIEAKENPAIAHQNPTPRRLRIAASMREDAKRMELTQQALFTLADHHDAGTIPPELADIRTRKAAEEATDAYSAANAERFAMLSELMNGNPTPPDEQRRREAKQKAADIRRKEAELSLAKIPGYFPTPEDIAAQVIEYAEIEPDSEVLEPSAGSGRLADAAAAIGARVYCVEINHELAELLTLKGHNVETADALTFQARHYDRIVMNPPFEKGQDADHIRHMRQRLAPGGRMVAICSEGLFFRTDKKATAFREWLENEEHAVIDVPAGAFLPATGVKTRIIIIDDTSDI